ncbi:MAG TPA: methionyl-tRNA formyltransferase [Gammaproteobacteria bacterium]|nr:methionyl-tRNA formyltransferase [Gammaproteobacteria bacterium]
MHREHAEARIAFAGTPHFAVPALRAIVAARARVPLVLTQPDRPAGRGRRLTASPVKELALEHGLPLAQPESLRAPAEPPSGERPDLMVVIAYGLLLPRRWLDWPRLGCINLHASLLPRWRGAAPIQRAVLAGDAETGISVMQMNEGLDTGPVHSTRPTPIGARETAGALHDRLALLAAEALLDALPRVLAGTSTPVPQRDALATLAPKIEKSEARLDWREPAQALERRVRAFNAWPVAEAHLRDGRRLRVFEAAVVAAERPAPPGSIVAAGRAGIDVAAGDGVLRLLKIQPPSGRVMDAGAYLAAHSLSGAEFVV